MRPNARARKPEGAKGGSEPRASSAIACTRRSTGNTSASAIGSAGQEGPGLGGFDSTEQGRERVDDPPDGSVRRDVLLVAASRQGDDLGDLGWKPAEEGAHERGLAQARLALDDDRDRRAAAALPKRRRERVQLATRDPRGGSLPMATPIASAGRNVGSRRSARSTWSPVGRASGSKRRSAVQSASRSAGTPRQAELGGGGSSRCLRVMTCSGGPSKGTVPVSASNSMTPSAYQSASGPTWAETTCSGAM